MFKKILPYIPKHVAVLYYNSFIRSAFSYCLMFWFNNHRSGRFKLVSKIDHMISFLAKKYSCSISLFISDMKVFNTWSSYELQCLTFMHDLMNGNISINYLDVTLNENVHSHFTRASCNLHISQISHLDTCNFIYHCKLFWNSYMSNIRNLRKPAFVAVCKQNILVKYS